MRRAAVLWRSTVLGEAAGQVPAEIKTLHSDIAWAAATRLRNRILHGYWSIDLTEGLPTMFAGLEVASSVLE